MTRTTTILSLIIAAALALALALAPQKPDPLIKSAQAATTNVGVAVPGVMLIPLHFTGQYTTTITVSRFAMPMACDMLGVGASARAMGTTAMTVDVKSGGTTILSAPITLSAGAYTEGTVSTAAIPDENAITVDLNAPSGTSTLNDVTVLMTCVRK